MEPNSPKDLLLRPKYDEDGEPVSASVSNSLGREVPLERFQTLEKVVRDSPITVEPYIELATIYFDQHRWSDVRRVLDLGLAKFPEDEQANYLHEEAQLLRSLEIYNQAKAAHEAEPTRLTLEPLERSKLEVNVLREKVCRARLARHPEQLELNLTLATALENLGQIDEATLCLEAAVTSKDIRSEAALRLGRLYEKSNRITDALSAYRRAAFFRLPAPSEETKVAALMAAANLSEKAGMVDSAQRYIEMLSELQPQNSALQQRLQELRQRPL
ncbi:MAG: hypothetical protein AB8B50_04415 [Pirellulaceae bacterium]